MIPADQHGTANCYQRLKCRCDQCRDAKRAYYLRIRRHGVRFPSDHEAGELMSQLQSVVRLHLEAAK